MQCWWALSLETRCIAKIYTRWLLLEVIIILILSLVLSRQLYEGYNSGTAGKNYLKWFSIGVTGISLEIRQEYPQ